MHYLRKTKLSIAQLRLNRTLLYLTLPLPYHTTQCYRQVVLYETSPQHYLTMHYRCLTSLHLAFTQPHSTKHRLYRTIPNFTIAIQNGTLLDLCFTSHYFTWPSHNWTIQYKAFTERNTTPLCFYITSLRRTWLHHSRTLQRFYRTKHYSTTHCHYKTSPYLTFALLHAAVRCCCIARLYFTSPLLYAALLDVAVTLRFLPT